MKLVIVLLLPLSIFVVGSKASFGGVADTAHNLSATNARGEICLPCHVPHGGNASVGFLWNHGYRPDSAFQKYDGASLTIGSLACLGCHDGQTSVDDYFGGTAGSSGPLAGKFAFGTDLTNDHPVGVPYPTGNAKYAVKGTVNGSDPAITAGAGQYLPLFPHNGRDQIECSTCHSAHSTTESFLRFPNTASALCTACHVAW